MLLDQTHQAAIRANEQSEAQALALEAAQLRVQRARLEVKSKVRRAYYQLGIAQRRAVQTRAMEDAARENVQLSQSKVNKQEYSKVDLLRARVQTKRLATARQNAEADLAAAIVRLQATVNSPLVNFDDEAIRQKIADQLPMGDDLIVDIDAEAWSSRHPDLAEAARDVELELASVEVNDGGVERQGHIEPQRSFIFLGLS